MTEALLLLVVLNSEYLVDLSQADKSDEPARSFMSCMSWYS